MAIKFDKLASAKPKPVAVSREEMVATRLLEPGQGLPLVFEPAASGVDFFGWADVNREMINAKLAQHGGLLFRGFDVTSTDEFEQFTRVLCPELMAYGERSSPRHKVSGSVYTSTDHPPDQPILLHNEQSYTLNWMMKLWFYCDQPATQGGATPLADSRRILNRLDAQICEAFETRHIMYVRNYGVGLGLSWPEAFQTDDRSAVQSYCDQNDIQCEWLDGERLRTRQVRPAIRQHPVTGDRVWFNHALFFHISSLEAETRESIMAGLNDDEYPFNTYYGDGSPFEEETLQKVRAAYDAETIRFSWQKGDVVMLDNMLTAHGRDPFVGERRTVVAMAEPFQDVGRS